MISVIVRGVVVVESKKKRRIPAMATSFFFNAVININMYYSGVCNGGAWVKSSSARLCILDRYDWDSDISASVGSFE